MVFLRVPPGSTPVFIYVNHFADNVSTVELHLYADDTTAFVTSDTIDQVSQLLNFLLADICSRCE